MNNRWSNLFEENGREHEIIANSPENTLIHQVYQKSVGAESCFLIDNKLNIFPTEFNSNRFMVGPSELIKKMVDFGRVGFSSNMFRNTESVAEILRAFYLSKRLPSEIKEFLNQWYAILLESLAVMISADY